MVSRVTDPPLDRGLQGISLVEGVGVVPLGISLEGEGMVDITDMVLIEVQTILEMMIFQVPGDPQVLFHTEKHHLHMQEVSILLVFQALGIFLVVLLLLHQLMVIQTLPILQDLGMDTQGMVIGMDSTKLSNLIKTKVLGNLKTGILRKEMETLETLKTQEIVAEIKEMPKT